MVSQQKYRMQTERKGAEKERPFYAIDLLGELLNWPLDLKVAGHEGHIITWLPSWRWHPVWIRHTGLSPYLSKLGRLKPVLHGTIRVVPATEPVNAAVTTHVIITLIRIN